MRDNRRKGTIAVGVLTIVSVAALVALSGIDEFSSVGPVEEPRPIGTASAQVEAAAALNDAGPQDAGPEDRRKQAGSQSPAMSQPISGSRARRPVTLSEVQDSVAEALINEFGAEEAEFRVALSQVAGWPEARKLIRERESDTGRRYDTLYLNVGLGTGGIAIEELEELAGRVALPESTAYWLTKAGRIDDLAHLYYSGLITDVDFLGNSNSERRSVAHTLVRSISYSPSSFSAESAERALRDVIRHGGGLPREQAADALLMASLNVNNGNFEVMRGVARTLVELGARPGPHHFARIKQIDNASIRAEMAAALNDGI